MSSKLADLKASSKKTEPATSPAKSPGKKKNTAADDEEDLEMGPASPTTEVNKQIEVVKVSIKKVEDNTTKMKKLNDKAQFSNDEQKEIMQEIEILIASSKSEALQAKQTLDRLDKETRKLEQDSPGATSVTIRRNLIDTNVKQLSNAVKAYQETADSIRNGFKENIKRQVRLVDGKISDAQIEQAVNSADPSQILRQALGVSDMALDAVAELEERHERMRAIEQGVKEILELFQDLALLVNEQQETLNNISSNVSSANRRATEGQKQIMAAESSQKRSRKCQFLAMAGGAIVLVLIVVFASVFTKK